MKTILIIGDDKLGRRAVQKLQGHAPIYLNSSSSLKRIFRLVYKKILRFDDLLRMAWAEFLRPKISAPNLPHLYSNQDVIEMVEREQPDRVICFRAGLIIGKRALSTNTEFLNLHYADLPEWGGLASLLRAMRAKAYGQNACLHEMVSEIDGGEVYARQPYKLDPALSYQENEDHAFDTGLVLLTKIVSGEVKL